MDHSVDDQTLAPVPEPMMRRWYGLSPSDRDEAKRFELRPVRSKRIATACARQRRITRLIEAILLAPPAYTNQVEELYQRLRQELLIDLEDGGFADARVGAAAALPNHLIRVTEGIRPNMYLLGAELTELCIGERVSPNLAVVDIIFMDEDAAIGAIEQQAQQDPAPVVPPASSTGTSASGTRSDESPKSNCAATDTRSLVESTAKNPPGRKKIIVDLPFVARVAWDMKKDPKWEDRDPSQKEVCAVLAKMGRRMSVPILSAAFRDAEVPWFPPKPIE